MAVTSVKQLFRSRPSGVNGPVREHEIVFLVQTDSVTDRGPTVISAVGIPARFSPHPDDPASIAIAVDADPYGDGPYAWHVKVKYSTEIPSRALKLMETAVPSGSQGTLTDIADPLNYPPQISWDSVKYEEPIVFDLTGELIVNTAKLGFVPAPTKVLGADILRVTRNEVWYDPHVASSYRDTINRDTFWGYEPEQCKIENISGRYANEKNKWFAVVTYEIHIRRFVTVTFKNGSIKTFKPWNLNILNAGLMEMTGTNSDGSPKYKQITDGAGNPVSEPHPLAEDGTKLLASETPFFREFQIYEKATFSTLGLPDIYA